MKEVRILKQLVVEYQQERYGPPTPDVARDAVKEMIQDVGLQGVPDKKYWSLWAICALMNQEPFCREWKKRKPTRADKQKRIAARAKALASVLKQREVINESDLGETRQRRTAAVVGKRN